MSTILYSRAGAGEAVVLIHGIGHSRRAWDPLPTLLADRYDVITVDLPGHGESPKPALGHGWSLPSHAEQLEELFDELGLDRPHVIGNSLGGAIALELAARGRVASATAISPAGFSSPAGTLWAGAVLNTLKVLSYSPQPLIKVFGGSEFGRKLLMGSLYAHPERLTPEAFLHDTLGLRRSRGFLAHIVRVPFYRFTRPTLVPTTILWGDRDRVLLPTQAKVARRRLPDATHASLGHAGHCAQHDVPELVVEHAVATFAKADPARLTA